MERKHKLMLPEGPSEEKKMLMLMDKVTLVPVCFVCSVLPCVADIHTYIHAYNTLFFSFLVISFA